MWEEAYAHLTSEERNADREREWERRENFRVDEEAYTEEDFRADEEQAVYERDDKMGAI